ncbi:GNAT family N-acetyltransferase [Streptomyces cavernicola]|uniref:GNAT family N-acetyltransferase n=1 Tax=Streptomyces cavernicola TaxID=3043613 RepID=A0ABT6SBC4_9ACTN|nr:GNAT family N-acetyltransferase [Streptomyces sp. B-S-A6]MDI3405501.1 GNAT family N-acetyltransferase [Streptomyces sp. B-S-A6]
MNIPSGVPARTRPQLALVWPTEEEAQLQVGIHRLIGDVTADGGAIGYLAPPPRDETDAWLGAVLADVRAGDAAFAVATVDGRVAGCGLWQRRGAVATYRHSGELRQLMTHPAARGLGLGQLLVSGLVEQARTAGMELLTLGVRGNNHSAIELYNRLGFREWGRLPGGIAVGEERFDDVKMWLPLGDLRPSGR